MTDVGCERLLVAANERRRAHTQTKLTDSSGDNQAWKTYGFNFNLLNHITFQSMR